MAPDTLPVSVNWETDWRNGFGYQFIRVLRCVNLFGCRFVPCPQNVTAIAQSGNLCGHRLSLRPQNALAISPVVMEIGSRIVVFVGRQTRDMPCLFRWREPGGADGMIV